jgi:competence protein ComEC
MLFRWTRYPMVRLAFYLGAGICFAQVIHVDFFNSGLCPALLLTLTALFYILIQIRKKLAGGFLTGCLIFLCGVLLVTDRKDSQDAFHLTKLKTRIKSFQGVVVNNIEKTQSGYKLKIRIIKVRDSLGWKNYFADCLFYFRVAPDTLTPGTYVLATEEPKQIIPDHDHRFRNQMNRLIQKNIHYQFFAKTYNFKKIGGNPAAETNQIERIKKRIQLLTAQYISGVDERIITEALLIGKTDGLSDHLRQAYAASGTMHVLAVSGLHVGIIYWILLIFLKPLTTFAHGRWLIASTSIVILWCYAALTGFSPSVLRAVAMFTFVAISNPFGLRSQTVNTLAASLFILLIYDPGLISNIGFQLSYLAVAGIIWIHPVLYKTFQPNHKAIDYCWSIISVSIAAQLTTFPLTVYYFHQFPVYFIPANLIIIPLSFLILLICLIFIALGSFSITATLLGKVIEASIGFMNSIAHAFQELPGQLPNDIQLTISQAFILMTLNVLVISMLMYRKKLLLIPAFILALIFAATDFIG